MYVGTRARGNYRIAAKSTAQCMMIAIAMYSYVAVFSEGCFSVHVFVPAQFAMSPNEMLTIPVGAVGCSGPLGIYMCWVMQNKDGEIMENDGVRLQLGRPRFAEGGRDHLHPGRASE